MNHMHNPPRMSDPREEHQACPCGKDCSACQAEQLSVSCGCDMEAKQYEYGLTAKLRHARHEHQGRRAGHAPRAAGAMQHVSHTDHEAAMTNPQMAAAMEADMRRRFWVSLALSLPIFLYSAVGVKLLGRALPSPLPVNWLLLVLTTPIVFWAGSIFITGTYYSLRARKLNMAVLIATGVLAAYGFSVVLTFTGDNETFYEAAALLVTFVLFGHWMEMKSRRGTSDALRKLFDLVPPMAIVLRAGKELSVPSADIRVGDTVVIRPGDKIPVDGTIIDGLTTIDEALVTGESLPVSKGTGDRVVGGAINQAGAIRFTATKVGSETVLAQIVKLVETAQNSKAPGQRIADKAAAYLVIVAIGSGLLTLFGWYVLAGAPLLTALTFAVSAVVIACPDALGLATPTAVAVGTGIGARHNILIKDASTLEQTARIQAIVLDKTGTLTEGKPKVVETVASPGHTADEVVSLTAAAEKRSSHPIGAAIVEEASRRSLVVADRVEDFRSIAGHGIEATIDGKRVLVGTEKLMGDERVDLGPLRAEIERLVSAGNTISILAVDGRVAGAIGVADTIKPTARQAVAGLQHLGIEVAMITGDHERVAKIVADQLGITRVFAQVLPGDKAGHIKRLQAEGKFVAMVGDGVNDAPALAQADIGIAIGAGTDVAIETANIVLMKSDPADILRAITLSKATVRKMRQNLWWASIYNLIAIPVAAGVFYNSLGLSLRPEVSALLMSVSSIFVATNAVLLKRVESELRAT
jgi:Cu2+-exporting ATPase